jgi:hypothetical protein
LKVEKFLNKRDCCSIYLSERNDFAVRLGLV